MQLDHIFFQSIRQTLRISNKISNNKLVFISFFFRNREGVIIASRTVHSNTIFVKALLTLTTGEVDTVYHFSLIKKIILCFTLFLWTSSDFPENVKSYRGHLLPVALDAHLHCNLWGQLA